MAGMIRSCLKWPTWKTACTLGLFTCILFLIHHQNKYDSTKSAYRSKVKTWSAGKWKVQLHTNTSSAYVGQCQRKRIVTTAEECEIYKTNELEDKRIYLANHVSGAPGSGNDWLMWLASPTRYTWNLKSRYFDCSIYLKQDYNNQSYKDNTTECLFMKSHEPWPRRNWSLYAKRVALLLRHPYDAEFAEYKRQLMEKSGADVEAVKSGNDAITTDKFVNVKKNMSSSRWRKHVISFTKIWLAHATYWLTKSSVPLHVLVYNSLKTNTEQEVEELQAFFGYTFDGANFRRHCCVVKDSYNVQLKRASSPVDKYKNYAYEQEEQVRQSVDDAVSQVHQMLDNKFPDRKYRITRG